ncbi:GNAT family N-acetyltransferase [Aeromonas veronii]
MAAIQLPLTRRLYVDTLVEADYPRYRALYTDPRVSLPTGVPMSIGEETVRLFFESALAYPVEQGRIAALRLNEDSGLYGVIRLTDWDKHAGVITLGYALSPQLWGEGLMKACLENHLPSLFSGALGHPLHRIQAWVQVNNFRSRHLLEKLGFSHEGTLRGLFRNEQGYHDICIYGQLASDVTKSFTNT